MKQAVLGYEKQFFIDGTQISGVQSIDGSYAIQEKPINVLGWGHVNHNFNDLKFSFGFNLTSAKYTNNTKFNFYDIDYVTDLNLIKYGFFVKSSIKDCFEASFRLNVVSIGLVRCLFVPRQRSNQSMFTCIHGTWEPLGTVSTCIHGSP